MYEDNALELTSRGPIDIKSIVPSLCADASLATVAFIKENRKEDIIAYNAFLVEAAVTASTDTTITIPTSYADVTTFRFDRVVKDTLDNESIYDMVGDLFNPLAYGQSVAVVAYGQTGLEKSKLLLGTKEDMGIIARAIVDVFSRIDSVADSAGTPSVFLAAYDTLGKNLSPNLDVARLAEAGVDVRLLRHVEIAPHQKSLSVNVTSAVSALAVLQTIASTRNHALKVNPKLATTKHFLVTLRVEWPAGEVFLAHFADVAALEDAWTKDCYGQHKHEWRTTCTRDPGPTLPPHELKNLITRNSDLLHFERMVQARHTKEQFIPSKSSILSVVLGRAFTHSGRAALLLTMSPFLADKKLAVRTLGLGVPVMDTSQLQLEDKESVEDLLDGEPDDNPAMSPKDVVVSVDVDECPCETSKASKRLSAVTPHSCEVKLSVAAQEQIAMYVRHVNTAMTKQQHAEKTSQKMQAALAHITEILRKTEESRDKAKAKLKAYRDKVAKDRKRFSGASGQMTVVIQKEKALEQERKAMNADMEQLRKELSESQERCARLQRENARLKRDVATKSSIVDRVIAEYNTKLKEFSGEIEAERRVQTNIHSRLAARETDILETSVNMQRLQRELEDCKLVMYRAIGCDPTLADAPKSAAVSEALVTEARRSKTQLADALAANAELQRQLSAAHATLSQIRQATPPKA